MNNNKIKQLLKQAEIETKKTGIQPRRFERTPDGKLILDPNKEFDRDWYEDDDAYDL